MNTPSWFNPIPACPIQAIHVAADGANGWALSNIGELYYFSDANQSWSQIPSPTQYMIKAISSGPDTSLIATTSHGETFQYVSGNWSPLFHPNGIVLAATGDANNYILGDGHGLFHRHQNGTESPLGSTWITEVRQISTVPAMDHIWAIRENLVGDNVFFWGGDWIVVSGVNLRQFDFHQNTFNGKWQVVGVDANGAGWVYSFETGLWSGVSRVVFGAKFTSLESSNGYMWAVSDIGTTNNVHRGTFVQ